MKTIHKFKLSLISLAAIACFATSSSTYAKDPIFINQADQHAYSLAPILKNVMPTVVNIVAQRQKSILQMYIDQQQDSPKNRRSPSSRNALTSLGSGVIINAKKGYIITNAHVINKSDNLIVTLSDGQRYKGKLIGEDMASDIAVVQIKAPHLKAITVGNSNHLEVGDYVIAIGSPFGLNKTVTSGIVSALQRTDLGIENYENFIQTDAPINPGSSGGALVNLQGQLVGINTAIIGPNRANVGISFAIPANMGLQVAKQLIQYGKVKRGLAGIMLQKLTPQLAEVLKVKVTEGAIITQVVPNSPAAKADLKVGDIILTVNQAKVKSAAMVRNMIGLQSSKDVTLQVMENNQIKTIHLKLDTPGQFDKAISESNPLMTGLTLSAFDRQTTIHGLIHGILVVNVDQNSPGWRAGLRPSDIIVSVNRQPVSTLVQMNQHLTNQKQVLLRTIARNGASEFIVLKD